jgi:hypothetical protein
MERKELEQEIRRYDTILRFVTDERTVTVVSEMLAEARNRLSNMHRNKRRQEPLPAAD